MTLGQLVDGQWVKNWTEQDQEGRFQRMPTRFHHQITADGSGRFPVEAGRYHLYVSLGCPWAHRTVIMRELKGLQAVVGLSIVDPVIREDGWVFSNFPGASPDPVNQAQYLREIYLQADPHYTGRVTVPVLWDKQTHTIVNNESRQIIRMLDVEFHALATRQNHFYPDHLQPLIEQTLDAIYQPINNGVYRAGFAATQAAYEAAVTELFTALEHWDQVLGQQRYLCGDQLTEADWCMFTTLYRFELAYFGIFKCNLKSLRDFTHLWNYLKELYQYPGVREVCREDHVKHLYYRGLPQLNPTQIVPRGPLLDLESPHSRHQLNLAASVTR
ncbi:MAG: glutathione S-transferase family protein [Synechococcaceae cyanobacterium SM2_3_1]|nr:glutathione S-transferase family protein [Synechococcaceae cyanobacterium SM2_3_1]